MAKLFGSQLKSRGGQGTLLFSEYLDRVGVRIQPEARALIQLGGAPPHAGKEAHADDLSLGTVDARQSPPPPLRTLSVFSA